MPITREEALRAYEILGKLIEEHYQEEQGPTIHTGIFHSNLSPFSALVTCLNQQGMSTKEIARILNRNKSFVTKSIQEQQLDNTGRALPLNIFTGKLSILESAAAYLSEQGLSTGQIATELGRTSAVVWTLLDRARKKEVSG